MLIWKDRIIGGIDMWWIILVIIILIMFMFIRAIYIKNKYCFKCEKCKCECQPSIFSILGNLNNYVGAIYLKCPNCKDKQKMILINKDE